MITHAQWGHFCGCGNLGKNFSVLCGVFFLSFIFSASAEAKFSAGPSISEIRLKPGEQGSAPFELYNTYEQDLKIEVEAVNWLVRGLGREGNPDDVNDWLQFEEYQTFTLPATSKATLTADLIAPEGFTGERVAQVFFAYEPVEPNEAQARTSERIRQRIGLLICLGARGTEAVKGTLTITEIKQERAEDGSDQVTAYYTIENLGNVHIRPRGNVRIAETELDKTVYEQKMGYIRGLYTEEKRDYTHTAKDLTLEAGKMYEVSLDLKFHSYDLVEPIQAKHTFKIEAGV